MMRYQKRNKLPLTKGVEVDLYIELTAQEIELSVRNKKEQTEAVRKTTSWNSFLLIMVNGLMRR